MVRVSMLKINGAHQISKADSIFCWCIQCICTWIHNWICILCVFVFVTCLSRNHPSQPKLLGPPQGGHWSQIPARGDMFNFIQNQCKKFWLKPMFARKFKRTLLTSMLSISILLVIVSPSEKSEKTMYFNFLSIIGLLTTTCEMGSIQEKHLVSRFVMLKP